VFLFLTERQLILLRPVRNGEAPRVGQKLFKPRQVIESVNRTLKASLTLNDMAAHRRGHPSPHPGADPRPDRRDLAQRQNGQHVMRSLIAYDH